MGKQGVSLSTKKRGASGPLPARTPYSYDLSFLKTSSAAEILAFQPTAGIRAVRGGGVLAIGVATTYSPADLRKAGADHVIPNFQAAELRRILEARFR